VSIAVPEKNQIHPSQYVNEKGLVAFSATNRVTVVAMRPQPERVIGLNKHVSCRKNAIPYSAWGYGLTPIKCREKTVPLLAVAWDSII
jgi:hypothetical protein